MSDQYNLFARFYRELIITSGHLKNEQETFLKIISKLGIGYSSEILDAACGTGDALFFLYNKGYMRLTGLDFSEKMLDEAKNILPDVKYYHKDWNSMASITELENRFDLVLVISVSILHVDSICELETTFRSFHGVLKKNAALVIDNRLWEDSSKGLVEAGREINHYNYICTSEIRGEEYKIGDICSYIGNKQKIEYKIKSNSHTQIIKVTYLRISTSSIVEVLYKAGFCKVVVESCNTWPYELIYAHK